MSDASSTAQAVEEQRWPVKDLASLLAQHPLLEGLPGEVAGLMAGCARNVAFAAGQVILAEGAPADTFYLLRRGHVALEVRTPGRTPLVVQTLAPGAVLGWSWLIPPYRWHLDARAMEAVGAVAVDAACLRDKAEADPAFGYALLKRVSAMLVDRLKVTELRLLDLYGSGRAT